MKSGLLRSLLAVVLVWQVQLLLPPNRAHADQASVASDHFLADPRVGQASSDLLMAAMNRCSGNGGDIRLCLASVVPYGPEMSPYCQGFSKGLDTYFCLALGAAAIDLIVQTGAIEKLTFIQEHGPEGEHAFDSAGEAVIEFLGKKCSGSAEQTGCGPREAENLLQSAPNDKAACSALHPERKQIACLITGHLVEFLQRAKARA